MQNNFVLRSVRYMLDLSDAHVVEIMKLADYTVTKELVNSWLKKDDEPEFVECDDNAMGHFLNGLIFIVVEKMKTSQHLKLKSV